MNILNDIEPSGRAFQFASRWLLQKESNDNVNILWFFGTGSNGKTTWIRMFEKAFPDKVIRAPTHIKIQGDMLRTLKRYHLVFMNADNADEIKVVRELARQCPNSGFIVESVREAPRDLPAHTVECKKVYSGKEKDSELFTHLNGYALELRLTMEVASLA